MQACKPSTNEARLSATFNFTLSQFGCTDVAYPNIVASGNNACCLHYEVNCCTAKDGQMLLIDAGGELNHYASDISRSYPVNGKFTDAQKNIYPLVLNALDSAIAKVRPGTPWNEFYDTGMQVIAKGLLELGFLSGSIEDDILVTEQGYENLSVYVPRTIEAIMEN